MPYPRHLLLIARPATTFIFLALDNLRTPNYAPPQSPLTLTGTGSLIPLDLEILPLTRPSYDQSIRQSCPSNHKMLCEGMSTTSDILVVMAEAASLRIMKEHPRELFWINLHDGSFIVGTQLRVSGMCKRLWPFSESQPCCENVWTM